MRSVADASGLRRTYRYRIYPTVRQRLALEGQLSFACELYNAALEQRRIAWRSRHLSIGYVAQCRDLTDVRRAGLGPHAMTCHAMRDPLRRLDRAFAAFFRREKAGGNPGYPRFRSVHRYDSLTWDMAWGLRERRLVLPGIGHVKVKWQRALPSEGVVRTVTVRRVAGRWHACFSLLLEKPTESLPTGRPSVGIDLGIHRFASLSNGEQVYGPRAYSAHLQHLQITQRRLSRRNMGSRRRRKIVLELNRQHERIRNLRRDHAHKVARRLVTDFGLIAIEDLNFRGLARGFLAKHVRDQGWAAFLTLLEYKAVEAGTRLVRVMPGGTSQVCSRCGVVVQKPLSERTHRCPTCGLVIDRDTNAARNILRLGLSLQAPTWPQRRALPEKAYLIVRHANAL
jgi:putative transposase